VSQLNNNINVSQAIQVIITDLMNRVLERVLVSDPFIKENHYASKPLYAALVPDEIFKGSHFERRFVTPFGSVWEKLAQSVALAFHQNCSAGHSIDGVVGNESLRRIQEVLNLLEHHTPNEGKFQKPNWQEELEYIQQGGGKPIPVSVTCDLFIDSEITKKKYAFELKAPLPNSDQTKVSKEKMFKLLAMNPKTVDHAYYALVYNPYGRKQDYQWTFPRRWFNMQEDESVLIGDEFWDLIGGDGTYKIFIAEVEKLGLEYKNRIYREYLEMEPPLNHAEPRLK